MTTSRIKDTRAYNFNEEAEIKNVQCITVEGDLYGMVEVTSPLKYYHHAGKKEYQCEVALLTRNIVIQVCSDSQLRFV